MFQPLYLHNLISVQLHPCSCRPPAAVRCRDPSMVFVEMCAQWIHTRPIWLGSYICIYQWWSKLTFRNIGMVYHTNIQKGQFRPSLIDTSDAIHCIDAVCDHGATVWQRSVGAESRQQSLSNLLPSSSTSEASTMTSWTERRSMHTRCLTRIQ